VYFAPAADVSGYAGMNEMKTSIFKRIRWLLVTAVICGGMFLTKPTTAFGDVLILTDGTVVQGLILSKSPDQVYVKDRQGEYRHYAMSDISRVEWRGTVETEGQVVSVRHTPEGADMAVPMSIRRQVDPQIAAAAARIIADSGPRFAGPDGGSIADPNWLVGPFHEAEPIQKKVVSTKPISSLGARTYTSARRSSDTSGKASATPRSSKSSRSSSSDAIAGWRTESGGTADVFPIFSPLWSISRW